MLFVAQNTKNVPIPRIYGYYTFGPFNRDVDDYGSLCDTYLFMGFADGTTLWKSWDSYDQAAKANIASQLKNHVAEIRNIPSAPWIGSVDRGAVNDFFLERVENKDRIGKSSLMSLPESSRSVRVRRGIQCCSHTRLVQNCAQTTHSKLSLRDVVRKTAQYIVHAWKSPAS